MIPFRLDGEAQGRPDGGASLSLGDALISVIGKWVAEARSEPASADRDRRVANLIALSASLSDPASRESHAS